MHLLDSLSLQIECRSDDADCIRSQISSMCPMHGVHCNQFFELCPSIDYAMMGPQHEL
jgi:hypothetical protein